MSEGRCSVIICAYTLDRWHDLLAAVGSLHAQTLPAREIIIVADHNAALLDRIASALPAVIAVPNQEERGLSGARNSGIAVASGEIIAFLDDDAMAEPDWLARLVDGYRDSRVLGVGGAIAPCWATGRPRWFPAEFLWVVGCTYRGMPTTLTPVRNMIGANMSFRRCVLAAVGGFRSDIGRIGTRPLGCEETELCIRARHRQPNGVILFDPHARVGHRVGAARARPTYFWARCYAEGRSKALVAHIAGGDAGLATERDYTVRTLPRGVLRGLRDAARGDGYGVLRAGFIVSGLAVTAAGFLVGKLSLARAGHASAR